MLRFGSDRWKAVVDNFVEKMWVTLWIKTVDKSYAQGVDKSGDKPVDKMWIKKAVDMWITLPMPELENLEIEPAFPRLCGT